MIVIRPVQLGDVPSMAHVHVDTWRTTYTGIVPDEHLANLSYERCQSNWIQHLSISKGKEHTFVAEAHPGQIVGFASCGPLREALTGFDGELYNIYVLKSYQGIGIGRQLVRHVAHELAGCGYHSLVIWVLKDNPACCFYERLGGLTAGEKVVEIGGKQLSDVAYVWPDLAVFWQDAGR